MSVHLHSARDVLVDVLRETLVAEPVDVLVDALSETVVAEPVDVLVDALSETVVAEPVDVLVDALSEIVVGELVNVPVDGLSETVAAELVDELVETTVETLALESSEVVELGLPNELGGPKVVDVGVAILVTTFMIDGVLTLMRVGAVEVFNFVDVVVVAAEGPRLVGLESELDDKVVTVYTVKLVVIDIS